jgi:hypothetical protein
LGDLRELAIDWGWFIVNGENNVQTGEIEDG